MDGFAMPFLTVFMRHLYSRPNMFQIAQASLDMQSCQDFQSIISIDGIGQGWEWAAKQYTERMGEVEGNYVLMMDDDDCLVWADAVAMLKVAAQHIDSPEVIIYRWAHA